MGVKYSVPSSKRRPELFAKAYRVAKWFGPAESWNGRLSGGKIERPQGHLAESPGTVSSWYFGYRRKPNNDKSGLGPPVDQTCPYLSDTAIIGLTNR